MTLAEITMPMTRGVMPVVDVPLLDALLVLETEGNVEFGVTTAVERSEVESGGVKRGAWVVEEEVMWEEADESVRLLAEDKIGRTDGKLAEGTVGGGTEDGVPDAIVGIIIGIIDTNGFSSPSADEDTDADADADDVGPV